MKILSLGLDRKILNANSKLANRIREDADLVDLYTVVVPAEKDQEIVLKEKAKAYGVSGASNIIKFFRICFHAQKLIKQKKYDVVTVQDPYFLALIGWWVARKFKIGLEIQVHGFEKFGGLRRRIARFTLSRASAVRVVSERMKKRVIEEFDVKGERITKIPIYSETDVTVNSGLPRSPINRGVRNDSSCVFLTVGRLVEVKNVGLQVRALVEVVKEYPNCEFWIVGDGVESRKLKVESKKLQVENKIKFLGWREDLEKYYEQADVFMLTSNAEGWGLVVIEAASFKLPIIMTDVGLAGEVIKDNESGLIIPIGDQAALEQAMARLIRNKTLRQRLGQGAQAAVKKLPTKEETLARYKQSWEKARLDN